jgi:hypothetical protein
MAARPIVAHCLTTRTRMMLPPSLDAKRLAAAAACQSNLALRLRPNDVTESLPNRRLPRRGKQPEARSSDQ